MLKVKPNSPYKTCNYVTVYEYEDISDKSLIVNHYDCKIGDKGKYLKFNDGSGYYAKITKVTALGFIYTDVGLFSTNDIVCAFKPKPQQTNYSGIPHNSEPFHLRPATAHEKTVATIIYNGNASNYHYTIYKKSKRIQWLVYEKIIKNLRESGIDEDFIAKQIKELISSEDFAKQKFGIEKALSLLKAEKRQPHQYKPIALMHPRLQGRSSKTTIEMDYEVVDDKE